MALMGLSAATDAGGRGRVARHARRSAGVVAALLVALAPLAPASPARAQGLIFETPEAYAKFPKLQRYRAFLPVRVDLSSRFPTPGNQGKQGSCVGWAVGYAARSYYAVTREHRPRNRATAIASPAYIYGAIKTSADCKRGTSIARALNLLKNTGALSLARFPYHAWRCPRPNLSDRTHARRFRIRGWRAIVPGRPDDAKGALARGNPVIIGIRLTRSIFRVRGNRVWHARGPIVPQQGHAITLVGYDERRQAFKLINSWGRGWGQNGFGWMSYGAYRRLAFQGYVMYVSARRRPGPGPTPPHKRRRKRPHKRVKPTPPKPVPPRPVVKLTPPLTSYKCASLRLARRGGATVVRGFVASAKDLAKLVASARRIGARVEVAVRPWPQCEVLKTFRKVFATAGAPRLTLAGAKRTYRKDDTLVIEVTAPKVPSYLYVIYIQADGKVVYLVQPEGVVPAPMPGGRKLVFGDGHDNGPRFTVGPPYGREMIVAIAAQSPLFEKPRPGTEIERAFLTAFRRAFLYHPAGTPALRKVAASWVVLTTKEK